MGEWLFMDEDSNIFEMVQHVDKNSARGIAPQSAASGQDHGWPIRAASAIRKWCRVRRGAQSGLLQQREPSADKTRTLVAAEQIPPGAGALICFSLHSPAGERTWVESAPLPKRCAEFAAHTIFRSSLYEPALRRWTNVLVRVSSPTHPRGDREEATPKVPGSSPASTRARE